MLFRTNNCTPTFAPPCTAMFMFARHKRPVALTYFSTLFLLVSVGAHHLGQTVQLPVLHRHHTLYHPASVLYALLPTRLSPLPTSECPETGFKHHLLREAWSEPPLPQLAVLCPQPLLGVECVCPVSGQLLSHSAACT